MHVIKYLCLLVFIHTCHAWDSEQLEVFDIIEEVKLNFYELLNITKDANSSSIRTAFRRLSVVLHPDKNLDVDTSEQFRNLVSVYEVLKDPNKRKYYDEVLANGLPNWRSAVYYYRHVRKMGLIEMSIILFLFITIGQYLVSWASYFEKKYTLEQIKPKKQKKSAPAVIIDLPKPSFYNTLPIQIPWLLYKIIVSIPDVFQYFKQKAMEKVEETLNKEPEEIEEEVIDERKTVRRRKPGFIVPEGPTFEATVTPNEHRAQAATAAPPVSGGLWTDDDLAELIRLVKRFPGGTADRWERIAESLERPVPEVTYMANKVKNNAYRLPSQEEESVEQPKIKEKTRGGKLGTGDANWSQPQQKALEDALAMYPKGAADRWDRIAEFVPEKTKDECMLRYKHLVEIIKKQKESKE